MHKAGNRKIGDPSCHFTVYPHLLARCLDGPPGVQLSHLEGGSSAHVLVSSQSSYRWCQKALSQVGTAGDTHWTQVVPSTSWR